MPKVLANGLNFHYLQVGQGPDLVMVHGLMGNQAVWHLKMVPLIRDRYRITTYDQRGHGRSEMPLTGYSTGYLADDLCGVLDALGIGQADLIGHSLGADVCLHFALRYPERVKRLVLIEAGIPALLHMRKDGTWEGWAYWASMIEEFTGVAVPREKWTDLAYMVRMSVEAPIVYGPARGLPRRKEPVLRLLEQTTLVRDYERVDGMTLETLATIPHPKLLVYDSGSPYFGTFEVLREVLINFRPLLFPASKHQHFSPLEQPELLLAEITKFLDQTPVGPTSVSAVQ